MPSPADKVELLIGGRLLDGAILGGKMHEDWESYEIDSDLLTPADAWRLTLGIASDASARKIGGLPAEVTAGAPVQVRVGGDLVLTGRIDEISHRVDKRSHTLTLCGRDGAAALVDCSAKVFVRRMTSLEEIMATVVAPLGISKKNQRIAADKTRLREKINVEPGDTAWDVLSHAAEANGLWPWFEPDGTLVIGGPDYTTAPVADLILRYDGVGNNVMCLEVRRSIAERYSELTVLGQTHGTELQCGVGNLHATATDEEMAAIAYRPKIIVDHESDNTAVAEDRARKLIADARLRGLTLTAQVKGHRILAAGQSTKGVLWTPGQRIRVLSEPHGISATFFLMGRKFSGGREMGPVTELTLKEDGIWTLDAHPHKRKHRRGKNDIVATKYTYDSMGASK